MVVRESGLPPADAAISLGKAKRDRSSTWHGLLNVSVQCGTAQDSSVKRGSSHSILDTGLLNSCWINYLVAMPYLVRSIFPGPLAGLESVSWSRASS